MKFTVKIIFFGLTILFLPLTCYANVIWPAIYVLDSYYRFWYLAIITVIVESYILEKTIKVGAKKAFLISFVANVFSATIGLYLLTFSMIGWHFVVDNFVEGTFHFINKVATLLVMLSLSVLLEGLLVKLIWKYRIKQVAISLFLGNFISYAVIAIDLFFFGGWNKSF